MVYLILEEAKRLCECFLLQGTLMRPSSRFWLKQVVFADLPVSRQALNNDAVEKMTRCDDWLSPAILHGYSFEWCTFWQLRLSPTKMYRNFLEKHLFQIPWNIGKERKLLILLNLTNCIALSSIFERRFKILILSLPGSSYISGRAGKLPHHACRIWKSKLSTQYYS